MRARLIPHPGTPNPSVAALEAEVSRSSPTQIELKFTLSGDLAALLLPATGQVQRADELWRHTCFEAFVQPAPGAGYGEVNLAPSRQWAAYRFTGYRQGMTPALERAPPRIGVERFGDRLEITASLDLDVLAADVPWRVGLTAVVEAADGAISYWSLAHPPGKPDFHSPAGLVLTLAPNG